METKSNQPNFTPPRNLTWRRPDGFHGSNPTDFRTISIGENTFLWIHNSNQDSFPFRLAGGWEDEVQTKLLNNLVAKLDHDDQTFSQVIVNYFFDSLNDCPADVFFTEFLTWLAELESVSKGDTWETDIIVRSLRFIKARSQEVQTLFARAADS